MKKLIFLSILFLTTSFNTSEKYLIIGDSISAYEHGWQETICKNFNANCTNLSQGGKTTDWMLETVKTFLKKNPSNFDKIYIYGGINDAFSYLAYDADKVVQNSIKNINEIVYLAEARHMKVVLILGYNAKIIKNTWIKDKKLEKECIRRYAKYQEELLIAMSKDTLLKEKKIHIITTFPLKYEDTVDGIHPSRQAHKKMADWIIEYDR